MGGWSVIFLDAVYLNCRRALAQKGGPVKLDLSVKTDAIVLSVRGDILDADAQWGLNILLHHAARNTNKALILDLKEADIVTATGIRLLGMIQNPTYPWSYYPIRATAPKNVRPWVISFMRAIPEVVFFANLQEALTDLAADNMDQRAVA